MTRICSETETQSWVMSTKIYEYDPNLRWTYQQDAKTVLASPQPTTIALCAASTVF